MVRVFRYFFTGGTYRKNPRPEPGVKTPAETPARGKRHRNESLKDFRERRRICNAKRRRREKENKHAAE